MKKPFKFKRFIIHQDRCAMKVGTDGVLLGAWAGINHNPQRILDIGAGTGLLALMLAQRTNGETIDALEIEENAHEQCVENFENAPWADRLFCYHAGLDEFTDEMEYQYDLIISNPPFFMEEVSSGNVSRDTARQNQSLPFEELLEGVTKLLAPKGTFATILPFKEEVSFLKMATHRGLFPNRITHVKGNRNSEIKRSLLEFSFRKTKISEDLLTIETERHQYTEKYMELTRPFYLKM
jgi:tRNA1Val (adenine37-N6)-methyltransferase